MELDESPPGARGLPPQRDHEIMRQCGQVPTNDEQFYDRLDAVMEIIDRDRTDPRQTQQELDTAYAMLVELQPAAEQDRERDAALGAAFSRVLRTASSLGLRRPDQDGAD
jgi:hypothetical protein